MTLAVLASLGTLFAWTLLLVDGGDLNRSGTFWIMVRLVGLWGAPTRIYARWTVLTLSLALFLWPASVGLACVALWISPPGTFPEHASLALAHRRAGRDDRAFGSRTGLPAPVQPAGGTGRATFISNRERPADALPPVDGDLVRAQLFLLMPFIPVALLMSGTFAVVAISPRRCSNMPSR